MVGLAKGFLAPIFCKTLEQSPEGAVWPGCGQSGFTRAQYDVACPCLMRSVLVDDEWDARETKMEVG